MTEPTEAEESVAEATDAVEPVEIPASVESTEVIAAETTEVVDVIKNEEAATEFTDTIAADATAADPEAA